MSLFADGRREAVSVVRRWWGPLWEGIEEVAGDKGFRIGMFGGCVSVCGAGYVRFKYGHELWVHGWCDVVTHGCFRSSCGLSRLIDSVT